ncbi:MAG: pyridoxal phosphate-dependent aminotransferase [bacterium]|nr:pyridoxal phosphate-dependent aminotransferase [bacterium]
MKLSERISRIGQSGTMSLFARIAAMRQAGEEVVSFAVGEPDAPPPESAKLAATEVIQDNATGYTVNQGLVELRQSIAEKFKQDQGLIYEPDQILITSGAKQAIYSLLVALCDEGDEVLLFSPFYPSYPEQLRLCGAIPVIINTRPEDNFQPTRPEIKKAITEKTVGMIVNSPNNPTGTVYDHRAIEAISKSALEHDLWVISDEIYEKIIYPPSFHISPAQHSPEMADRTLMVNGFSKAFAMTGWRLGYCAGPAEVITAANLLQSHTTSNAATISQRAALAVMEKEPEYGSVVASELAKERELMLKLLANIPGISVHPSSGAFYLWLRYLVPSGSPYADSLALANYLLENHGVALVPGSAFGCEGYLRLSYSVERGLLEDGCRRLKKGLEQILG